MKRKSIKFLCLIVFAIALSLTCTDIIYASVESDSQTATVKGYIYSFKSYANNDADEVWAATIVSSNTDVPIGYIGAIAGLYDSNDVLVSSSGWEYSRRIMSGLWCETPSYTIKDFYYSYGKVRFYNGQGYSEYNTYRSPFVGFSIKSGYEVNENGETYGCSGRHVAITGEEPDLIAAYGLDGTFGYVRSTELESEKPNTPEEAVAISQRNMNGRTINIYDKDGKTIISTFKVSPQV